MGDACNRNARVNGSGAAILPDVQGSDHCPITLTVD